MRRASAPLPAYPQSIGVVTSQTGAAIRDILQVLGRRFPGVRVVLRPALVQGEGAGEDIAQGIAELNAYGRVDVLIVGRGGGAAEDLAAFNSEAVVRAVHTSEIPVISAVGHEIDVTLTDLAADCRAPTPSAAAELAVRDGAELRAELAKLEQRSYDTLIRLLEENEGLLDAYRESYGLRRVDDLVFQNMQRVDELQKNLHTGVRRIYEARVGACRGLSAQLGTLSPLSVLDRGYSLTQRLEDGAVVQDAGVLSAGDRLRVRFAMGEAMCTVDEVVQDQDGI